MKTRSQSSRSPISLALGALLQFSLAVEAQTNYTIDWFTVNGGGDTSSDGVYSISGIIGEPEVGGLTGGSFTLEGGFWDGALELSLPPDMSLNELSPFSATATGADADHSGNALNYALVSGPAGLTVSTEGLITWTPDEDQGPGTNTVFISVTADSLSVTGSFTVVVRELNVAPVLNLPADLSMNELTPYTANATATDADVPNNTHVFALVSGPAGLAVSQSGVISWTPDEIQGPSTNFVTIRVTDTNPPAANAASLSATNTYTVIVNEVNSAPALAVPAMQTVSELTTLTVTNMVTDIDLPPNELMFTLVTGPAGAVLDPTSGVFTWTPTSEYAATTNVVTVRVTDTGIPSASDTRSFSVAAIVKPRLLNISEAVDGQFLLEWRVQPGRVYRLQATDSLAETNWTTLGDHSATGPALLIVDNPGDTRHVFYRFLDISNP